jgi:hypothetical protein
VVLTECSQLPCQQLFLAAASCNTDGQACMSQVTSMDPAFKTNYCHANGVIKRSSSTGDNNRYTTVMRVFGRDGSPCYTLEMSGAVSGDTETQVWKSPSGAVLLTGTWTRSVDRLILSCQGMSYDTREVGCPGLDGEPDTVTQCPAGACPD